MTNSPKLSKRTLTAKVLSLARPHLGKLLLGTLFLGGGAGINLLFPELLRRALNGAEFERLLQNPWPLVSTLAVLVVAQGICFYGRSFIFMVVGQEVVAKLRRDLYENILLREISFFDHNRSGDLVSRLSSDTTLVQNAVSVNLSVILRYTLQVLVGVVLMALISIRLTIAILIALPVLIILSAFLGKKLRKASRKVQDELGQANVIAQETISAARTVKAFAREARDIERYGTIINHSLQHGVVRSRASALLQSVASVLMNLSIVFIMLYGIHLLNTGHLSSGDLTGFMLYGVIVAISFAFLSGTYAEFSQALGGVERVFELLDSSQHEVVDQTKRSLRLPVSGELEFSSVKFAYPNRPEQLVLDQVSFSVRKGQRIALVGPSGAGKSTMTQLALGFYHPLSGSVSFDGIDLKEINLHELRRSVAIVAQEPELFSMSIAENLRLGRENATLEELRKVSKQANILDFIDQLPKGFDTQIGERGVTLSGGQRQRLAIARALLKDPAFLILDEATSALDSENEALVQAALNELMKDRTTLVIAHRLSTVKSANLVLVLEHGRVVQRGTHNELSSQPGLYKQLVERQELGALRAA